jgi:hypothetical protein
MKRKICFLLLGFYLTTMLQAQFVQTIRGVIKDKDTQQPLTGVNVILTTTVPQKNTISDEKGAFRFESVPNGRHEIQVSSIGYNQKVIGNIILSSAHEAIIEVLLEEKIYQGEEIIVKATQRKDKPINPMAQVSARSFTVEETERYAGSWGDPARMASNYAGVVSAGESRNDIIIRGNSPLGLLWRIEGINIPNPNHFGAFGTTGGPISMLNNNLLKNSDFYSGAFPAQYGNALSGAFDLNMRSGNNEKREYVVQIGLNGFEIGAEGPFSKSRNSSYLINYRYSFLGLMSLLGMDYGPEGSIPEYQDLSYKINIPVGKSDVISMFGIIGTSNVGTFDSKKDTISDFTYSDFGQDFTYKSGMMTNGVSNTHIINQNSRLITRLAASRSFSKYRFDSVSIADFSTTLLAGNSLMEWQYTGSVELRTKINNRNFLNTGLNVDIYQPHLHDSSLVDGVYEYGSKADGTMELFQGFIELNHKFTDNINLYTGIHFQYFEHNNNFSLEPRAGLKWNFARSQSLSLGYGLHSQMQPHELYFRKAYDKATRTYLNSSTENLDFSKSHHFVLGYDYLIAPNLRFKFETYYQYLFNIPVEQEHSSISMVNFGADFYIPSYDSLVNKGTASNQGIELTLEKFFSKQFYFLITTSIFDAKYKGSDGILRNSAFDNGYVVNVLGGYEIPVSKNFTIAINEKFITAGGKRSTPFKADLNSDGKYEIKYDDTKAYEDQDPPYLRLDFLITLRQNGEKTTNEYMVDFQNVTNHKNLFYKNVNRDTGEIENIYLQGFAFMVMWRMRF